VEDPNIIKTHQFNIKIQSNKLHTLCRVTISDFQPASIENNMHRLSLVLL